MHAEARKLIDQDPVRKPAEITLLHQEVLEELAPNDSAQLNEEAVKKLEKESKMRMYRDLCVDPGVNNTQAWEYMQKLLAEKYPKDNFELTDPLAQNITTTPGDYSNSYFSRRRPTYLALVEKYKDHGVDKKVKTREIKLILDKTQQLRTTIARFYSVNTNKDFAKYLDVIDELFKTSPHLEGIEQFLPKIKMVKRKFKPN